MLGEHDLEKKIELSNNTMLEEGLYDNDPNYIRVTVFEKIFGVTPISGFEAHNSLIDREKLMKWIETNKFVPFHSKLADYNDDGEERSTTFFVNREEKTMIILRRICVNSSYEPDIMSSDDSPLELKNKENPNRLAWISYYSMDSESVIAFKKFFDDLRIKEDSKNKLYMLKSTEYGGLELDSFPTNCNDVSIELNYGMDFLKVRDVIIDRLQNVKSGLYVFHGPPGTGKTSFVKYLTAVVNNRKFIFVPNTMVAELFSPRLVDKLYSFKNSVLILEDAEICIFKRDGNNNALVSGILNITDGLLKELLNISIIVTFNSADISELDKALLRKGRLKVMHKFDDLKVEDAQRLAAHLKKKTQVKKSMSLADVYNLDEETGAEIESEKVVGFGR